MIEVTFYKCKTDKILGFKAKNHGESIICAAVSILTQNTVNSIEMFTEAEFEIDFDPKGGFMRFILKDRDNKDALLLMNSLYLGIKSINEEYGGKIRISVRE